MSSTDKATDKPTGSRRSWMGKYGGSKDKEWTLVSPPEGIEVTDYPAGPSTHTPSPGPGAGLPYIRSSAGQGGSSPPSSVNVDRQPSRRSSSSSLTTHQLDQEASKLIMGALERTSSATPDPTPASTSSRPSLSFGRKSFSSMIGGLSSLSLTRGASEDKERGRTSKQQDDVKSRSSSAMSGHSTEDMDSTAASRARSTSPFSRRRPRTRDSSPSVEALKLSQSDIESDSEPMSARSIRPRNAFSHPATSDDESPDDDEDEDDSEEEWSDNDTFDSITELNTERNAMVPAVTAEPDNVDAPDPLGEGVNIIVPPEPYFPSTLNNTGTRNPRRKKSTRPVALPVNTSRPHFQRDRCTITLTQGDPAASLATNGRKSRRYVVASDLSEESRYAVEWGVGTVLRDGDEMLIVSVTENESRVDPLLPTADRVSKLRNQQERQTLAYILVRQVMGLLQRTKLNVTVACQAWHAKNARHMLLDIVDHVEPSMLIVGSRGLGQLKGILLGSTSHYLVQKCSVPVMVARRRLKRPARRSAHLSPHRARVSLAEAAGVERVTPKVDQEVEHMRDQLERDDERREEEAEEDGDTEIDGDTPLGRKVAGD